jgi:uncharacterized membrane protein YkoI
MTRVFRRWHVSVPAVAMTGLVAGCVTSMADVAPGARDAVQARFPDATITEVEAELGNVYEIELVDDGQSYEVKLHADGTLIEIETHIDATDLPEPVAATVAERTKGAELIEIERVEQWARHTLGGLTKLDEPAVYYEVEWRAGGFPRELTVHADGTVR